MLLLGLSKTSKNLKIMVIMAKSSKSPNHWFINQLENHPNKEQKYTM